MKRAHLLLSVLLFTVVSFAQQPANNPQNNPQDRTANPTDHAYTRPAEGGHIGEAGVYWACSDWPAWRAAGDRRRSLRVLTSPETTAVTTSNVGAPRKGGSSAQIQFSGTLGNACV
jgi:hypothetical protein